MPQIKFEETLPYGARDLYDTVMDVERYPEIFDFIEAVKVSDMEDGTKKADLVIKTPLMNFSYSCDISFTPPETIDIIATKGPFKTMNGQWRFTPCPDKRTKVCYRMDYELGFGLLDMVARTFLESQVAQTRRHLLDYVGKTLKPIDRPPVPKGPVL